eukprot:jgi/Mesvir1/8341/Mv12602-RA.1
MPSHRVNLHDIVAELSSSVVPNEQIRVYMDLLSRFILYKLSKAELDLLVPSVIGKVNVHLHNKFIRAILANASSGEPPAYVEAHRRLCSLDNASAHCLGAADKLAKPPSEPGSHRSAHFNDGDPDASRDARNGPHGPSTFGTSLGQPRRKRSIGHGDAQRDVLASLGVLARDVSSEPLPPDAWKASERLLTKRVKLVKSTEQLPAVAEPPASSSLPRPSAPSHPSLIAAAATGASSGAASAGVRDDELDARISARALRLVAPQEALLPPCQLSIQPPLGVFHRVPPWSAMTAGDGGANEGSGGATATATGGSGGDLPVPVPAGSKAAGASSKVPTTPEKPTGASAAAAKHKRHVQLSSSPPNAFAAIGGAAASNNSKQRVVTNATGGMDTSREGGGAGAVAATLGAGPVTDASNNNSITDGKGDAAQVASQGGKATPGTVGWAASDKPPGTGVGGASTVTCQGPVFAQTWIALSHSSAAASAAAVPTAQAAPTGPSPTPPSCPPPPSRVHSVVGVPLGSAACDVGARQLGHVYQHMLSVAQAHGVRAVDPSAAVLVAAATDRLLRSVLASCVQLVQGPRRRCLAEQGQGQGQAQVQGQGQGQAHAAGLAPRLPANAAAGGPPLGRPGMVTDAGGAATQAHPSLVPAPAASATAVAAPPPGLTPGGAGPISVPSAASAPQGVAEAAVTGVRTISGRELWLALQMEQVWNQPAALAGSEAAITMERALLLL